MAIRTFEDPFSKSLREEYEREKEDNKDSGIIVSGLESGAKGLMASGNSALGAVSRVVGADSFAREREKSADRWSAKAAGAGANLTPFSKIDGPLSAGKWALGAVAQNAPLLGSMALTAPFGGALGAGALGARSMVAGAGRAAAANAAKAGASRVAASQAAQRASAMAATRSPVANAISQGLRGTTTGARVGRTAGAAVPYGATTTGETYDTIRHDPKATGTPRQQALGAIGSGAVQTSLGLMFEPISVAQRMMAASKAAQAAGVGYKGLTPAKQFGVAALGEGATEAAEQAVQQWTHNQYNPEAGYNPAQLLEAAAAGSVVGGAFSLPGLALSSINARLGGPVEEKEVPAPAGVDQAAFDYERNAILRGNAGIVEPFTPGLETEEEYNARRTTRVAASQSIADELRADVAEAEKSGNMDVTGLERAVTLTMRANQLEKQAEDNLNAINAERTARGEEPINFKPAEKTAEKTYVGTLAKIRELEARDAEDSENPLDETEKVELSDLIHEEAAMRPTSIKAADDEARLYDINDFLSTGAEIADQVFERHPREDKADFVVRQELIKKASAMQRFGLREEQVELESEILSKLAEDINADPVEDRARLEFGPQLAAIEDALTKSEDPNAIADLEAQRELLLTQAKKAVLQDVNTEEGARYTELSNRIDYLTNAEQRAEEAKKRAGVLYSAPDEDPTEEDTYDRPDRPNTPVVRSLDVDLISTDETRTFSEYSTNNGHTRRLINDTNGDTLDLPGNIEALVHKNVPILYNGKRIPRGSIFNAVKEAEKRGEAVKAQDLFDLGKHAYAFRTEKKPRWIVETKTVYTKGGEPKYLVSPRKVYDERRINPIEEAYNIIPVKFKLDKPDGFNETARQTLRRMATEGLVLVGAKDDNRYYATPEDRKKFYEDWGVAEAVINDVNQLERFGTIIGKESGESSEIKVGHIQNQHTDNTHDGLMYIARGAELRQGVALRKVTDQATGRTTFEVAKGVGRGPLEDFGEKGWHNDENGDVVLDKAVATEEETINTSLQFGKSGATPGVARADSLTVNELFPAAEETGGTSNLNQIIFGMQKAAEYMRRDRKKNLKGKNAEDFLDAVQKAKYALNIPLAYLTDAESMLSMFKRFEAVTARAKMISSDFVSVKDADGNGVDGVKLNPNTYNTFNKRYREETGRNLAPGDTVIIHRDPSLPNATSMHQFVFEGITAFEGGKNNSAVVINPRSLAWKEAAGDFDGDSAVVMMETEYTELRKAIENEGGLNFMKGEVAKKKPLSDYLPKPPSIEGARKPRAPVVTPDMLYNEAALSLAPGTAGYEEAILNDLIGTAEAERADGFSLMIGQIMRPAQQLSEVGHLYDRVLVPKYDELGNRIEGESVVTSLANLAAVAGQASIGSKKKAAWINQARAAYEQIKERREEHKPYEMSPEGNFIRDLEAEEYAQSLGDFSPKYKREDYFSSDFAAIQRAPMRRPGSFGKDSEYVAYNWVDGSGAAITKKELWDRARRHADRTLGHYRKAVAKQLFNNVTKMAAAEDAYTASVLSSIEQNRSNETTRELYTELKPLEMARRNKLWFSLVKAAVYKAPKDTNLWGDALRAMYDALLANGVAVEKKTVQHTLRAWESTDLTLPPAALGYVKRQVETDPALEQYKPLLEEPQLPRFRKERAQLDATLELWYEAIAAMRDALATKQKISGPNDEDVLVDWTMHSATLGLEIPRAAEEFALQAFKTEQAEAVQNKTDRNTLGEYTWLMRAEEHVELAKRIRDLNEIYSNAELLTGRREFVPGFKFAAESIASKTIHNRELELINQWKKEVGTLYREMESLDSEIHKDRIFVIKQKLAEIRAAAELANALGTVTGIELLAYGPPGIATKIATVEEIQQVNEAMLNVGPDKNVKAPVTVLDDNGNELKAKDFKEGFYTYDPASSTWRHVEQDLATGEMRPSGIAIERWIKPGDPGRFDILAPIVNNMADTGRKYAYIRKVPGTRGINHPEVRITVANPHGDNADAAAQATREAKLTLHEAIRAFYDASLNLYMQVTARRDAPALPSPDAQGYYSAEWIDDANNPIGHFLGGRAGIQAMATRDANGNFNIPANFTGGRAKAIATRIAEAYEAFVKARQAEKTIIGNTLNSTPEQTAAGAPPNSRGAPDEDILSDETFTAANGQEFRLSNDQASVLRAAAGMRAAPRQTGKLVHTYNNALVGVYNAIRKTNYTSIDEIETKQALKEYIDGLANAYLTSGVSLSSWKPNEARAIMEAIAAKDALDKDGVGLTLRIRGAAGTGKTTIVRELMRRWRFEYGTGQVMLAAPTHRANSVLKAMSTYAVKYKNSAPREISESVNTLHKLMGAYSGAGNSFFFPSIDQLARQNRRVPIQSLKPGSVLIVDEASMTDSGTTAAIKNWQAELGFNIVLMGDDAQLPPVKEKTSPLLDWRVPEVQLNQVMRQRGSNPLLDILTDIRTGVLAAANAIANFVTNYSEVTGEGVITANESGAIAAITQLMGKDIAQANMNQLRVLAATNARVRVWNEKLHRMANPGDTSPVSPGEVIIGYRAGGRIIQNGVESIVTNVGPEVSTWTQWGNFVGREVTIAESSEEGAEVQKVLLVTNPEDAQRYGQLALRLYKTKELSRGVLNNAYRDNQPRVVRRQLQKAKTDAENAYDKLTTTVTIMDDVKNNGSLGNAEEYQGVLIKRMFDLAYASTVHKAQGGTVNIAVIDMDNVQNTKFDGEAAFKQKLLYTSMSRAARTVIAVGSTYNEDVESLNKLVELGTTEEFYKPKKTEYVPENVEDYGKGLPGKDKTNASNEESETAASEDEAGRIAELQASAYRSSLETMVEESSKFVGLKPPNMVSAAEIVDILRGDGIKAATVDKIIDGSYRGYYHQRDDGTSFIYVRGRTTDTSAQQLAVASHEIGHHIFMSAWEKVKSTNPKLAKEIKADYAKWAKENDQDPEDWDGEFNEWAADNIGRILTNEYARSDSKDATNRVEQWFAEAAKQIVNLYNYLTRAGQKPAASVEKFIETLVIQTFEEQTGNEADNTQREDEVAAKLSENLHREQLQPVASRLLSLYGLPDVKISSATEITELLRSTDDQHLLDAILLKEIKGMLIWSPTRQTPYIYLRAANEADTGQDQLVALAHEIGHYITHTHWRRVQETNPDLAKRVLGEYTTWRDSKGQGWEEGTYKGSFDEWMADNVGYWLLAENSKKEARNAVGKWFKKIASYVKDHYQVFMRTQKVPFKSIDEFMRDVTENKDKYRIREIDATEGSTMRGAPDTDTDNKIAAEKKRKANIRKKAVRSLNSWVNATKWPDATQIQALADILTNDLDTMLHPDDVDLITRAASDPAMRRRIADLVKREAKDSKDNALISTQQARDIESYNHVAASYLYILSYIGIIQPTPPVRNSLNKITKWLSERSMAMGEITDKESEEVITAFAKAKSDPTTRILPPGSAAARLYEERSMRRAQGMLGVAQRISDGYKKILAWYIDVPYRRIMDRRIPTLVNVAKGIQSMGWEIGGRQRAGFMERSRSLYQKFAWRAKEILLPLKTDKQKEQFRDIMFGVKGAEKNASDEAKTAVSQMRKLLDKLHEYTQTEPTTQKTAYRENYWPFIPAYNYIIDNMDAVVALYTTEDNFKKGWLQVAEHYKQWIADTSDPGEEIDVATAIKKIDDMLIGPNGEANVPDKFVEFYLRKNDTNSLPGWKLKNRGTEKIHTPGFRFMNPRELNFLLQSKDPATHRAVMNTLETNSNRLIDHYVKSVTKRTEYDRLLRIMTEIPTKVEYGEDGKPTKRPGSYEAIVEQAKNEGATDDDIRLMTNFIDAVTGMLGVETRDNVDGFIRRHKDVEWLQKFDSKGESLMNPNINFVRSWLFAWQAITKLTLAVFAATMDPAGQLALHGNWRTFVRSMKDTRDSLKRIARDNPTEAQQTLDRSGVMQHAFAQEDLDATHSGHNVTDGARWVLNKFFTANGVEWLTARTRQWSGMAALLTFADWKKKAENLEGVYTAEVVAKAKAELSAYDLEAADITVDSTGHATLPKWDENIEVGGEAWNKELAMIAAIHRFVDRGSVRPDPTNRPLYTSNPYTDIFGQWKGFIVAFDNNILAPAWAKLVEEGNATPMAWLALTSIPVMLFADMLRDAIKTAFDDDDDLRPKWKEGWTLGDHVGYAIERAGMWGRWELINDIIEPAVEGKVPRAMTEILGPTAGDIRQLIQYGPGEKNLPGADMWKDWGSSGWN